MENIRAERQARKAVNPRLLRAGQGVWSSNPGANPESARGKSLLQEIYNGATDVTRAGRHDEKTHEMRLLRTLTPARPAPSSSRIEC